MRNVVSALVLGAAMVIGGVQASASTWVDFTIVGTPSEPGTVTGRLEFDTTGVGVKATGLYIESIDTDPSRFFLFPNDNLINVLTGTNSFTVSADGVITAANVFLHGSDPAQTSSGITGNFFELNDYGYNSYEQDFSYPYPFGSSFSAVQNAGGFAGATFTPEATAAVPEPAAWTMMIGGFGLVGAAMRRRRTAAKVAVRFG